MGTYVIKTDIQHRLGIATMDTSVFDQTAYIPACEASVIVLIENAGLDYDDFSDNQKTIAKAAMIELTALTYLARAPKDSWTAQTMAVKKADPASTIKEMRENFKNYLGLLEVPVTRKLTAYGKTSGGDDHAPDGTDYTFLMFADTDAVFSQWD